MICWEVPLKFLRDWVAKTFKTAEDQLWLLCQQMKQQLVDDSFG